MDRRTTAPTGRTAFPHLTRPGRIGSMELRNRMVMCPMGVLLGNPDGTVSDNEAAYYEEARARGGVGLIIVGTACVAHPEGANHTNMPGPSSDRALPGMRDLAERVHRHGAKLAAQLNYMGDYGYVDVEQGRARIVPFVPDPPAPDELSMMVTPAEMGAMLGPFATPGAELGYQVAEQSDIERIIGLYADAAERCRRAGYDGVELHAGHGYLIDEFLSPRNRRADGWGGPIDCRARFLVEVVRAVRAKAGDDFPVWMRINAYEVHQAVGETFDDQLRAIELAVEAGVSAVHLTAYGSADVATTPTDSYAPHVVGPLAAHAARLKAVVDVPVITFGRFEPAEAEAVLARGDADFVSMGRKLIADPDLPAKVTAGRTDDIRPCIYQYRCIGNIYVRTPMRCVANPVSGREHDVVLAPTAAPRRVLVVGGGPAGLEAARLLAGRGHHVELREASARLGGALVAAGAADPVMDAYLGWLLREVERADVVLEVGRSVPADLDVTGFDDVVVATGGSWAPPALPGADAGVVTSVVDLTAWLADDDGRVGERVVVLGDGTAALAVAGVAAQRGRAVTVVGPAAVFLPELGLPGRFRIVTDIRAAGVRLVGEATVEGFKDGNVLVARADGVDELAADTVISATVAAPERTLAADVAGAGVTVHAIGDCAASGLLEGATNGALRVALAIN